MRYYYVPSSYRGRRFGKGIRGGALRGLGFLAEAVSRAASLQFLLFHHKLLKSQTNWTVAAVQAAEATGQPASIGKQLYNLWGRAKNVTIGDIANGIGSAAKTGLKYALPIMGAYTGYKTLAGLNALRMGLNDMQGKLGAPISESLTLRLSLS